MSSSERDESPDEQREDSANGLSEDLVEFLERLEAEDKLTAEQIVAEAADPECPAHRVIFRDDDAMAAYRHRLELARHLVRKWKITIVGGGVSEYKLRAAIHVPSEDRYKRTERAIQENGEEIERIARGELEAFRRKYGMLERFAKIVRETLLDEEPPEDE